MSATSSTPASGPLETVRRFINTLDIETGTDAILDPPGLRRWLADATLLPARAPVSSGDLRLARALREALREAAAANHDHTDWPADAVATINDVAGRAKLAISFSSGGAWAFEVRAAAVEAALGRLIVVVANAETDGTWARLKVCASDTCRWAFYDASRAGNGKWCTMRLCGNRAKQEAWRTRSAGTKP